MVGQALLAELVRLTTAIARAAEVAGDARRASALLELKTQQLEQAYATAQPVCGAEAGAPLADPCPAPPKVGVTSTLPPELELIRRQMGAQRGSGSRQARGAPRGERSAQDRHCSLEPGGRDADGEGQGRWFGPQQSGAGGLNSFVEVLTGRPGHTSQVSSSSSATSKYCPLGTMCFCKLVIGVSIT